MEKTPRKAKLGEALLIFAALIVVMATAIVKFKAEPHMPMFIGIIFATLMALHLGYPWKHIEQSMIKGITQALQSIIILAIIGILVGVWILSGVVPSMIYYGLKLLSPSIFLLATVPICAITSVATGSSWGTAGTMGIALMGIAQGMGIPAPIAAGAIISGAYFGDTNSPLSDVTNLAPAMAGTDVFTHIKAMIKPTVVSFVITLVVFGFLSFKYGKAGADMSGITELQVGLENVFNISPVLLLPPVIVIVSVAMKMPAVPGITLGIITAGILAPIYQGSNGSLAAIMDAGFFGYVSETGIESIDNLLTAGGLEGMMYSITLTILAMIFGGVAEEIGLLEVIVNKILETVKSVTGLVTATVLTAILSNITMPEQYISIVIPGRMYAEAYQERGYHPKLLSTTLGASGAVSGALVPWNTCGAYMRTVLGVSPLQYGPYAIFNLAMPIVTIILTAIGQHNYTIEEDPDTVIHID